MPTLIILDRMEIEDTGTEPGRLAAAVHTQMPELVDAVPIEAIAAALDIHEIRKAPTTGFEGALLMTEDRNHGAIIVNSKASRQRQRFTIAHELGHFLNVRHLPTNSDGGFTCRKLDLAQSWLPQNRTLDSHAVQEIEANRFAIELLAPQKLVRPFLRGIPDLACITGIAMRLDLSREASARRYIELKDEPLALVFSEAGVVRYTSRNDSFPYLTLQKGNPLPSLPSRPDGTSITDHEAADRRDWGDKHRRTRACGADPVSGGRLRHNPSRF